MFWNLFKSSKDINGELDKKVKENMNRWQNDINFLQSMQKLELKEGDIIVLRHPYKLSEETIVNLKSQIQLIIKSAGFNVKIMVLEEGMDIGVLRKGNNIDYKNLLEKYIQYIGDVEGTDFILACDRQYASDVKFSSEEWAQIVTIANQADRLRNEEMEKDEKI